MNIQTMRPKDLSRFDIDAWLEYSCKGTGFDSPFFHPGYVAAMAEFRPHVEVSVIRSHGAAVGFFASERYCQHAAQPLGVKLADFQGVVGPRGVEISFDDLLDGTNLSCFHYDHWLADQTENESTMDVSASPFMDLGDGYEEYLARRRAAGSSLLSQTVRKQRKLEREIGPLTFTWNDSDPAALQYLWKWKAIQREQSQTVNILEFDWVRKFLTSLCQARVDGLQGVVSTLRIGDRIIAVHLGMHTASALHYWFPAYDADFGRYSPGSILLLRLAERCAEVGISRIDLGKGEDRYKDSFATGSISVAAGTADRYAMRSVVRSSFHRSKKWIKSSPLGSAAEIPKRVIRQWQTQTAMKDK